MYDPLIVIASVLAVYFITSAIFMLIWNNSVKDAFGDGMVKKIGYKDALGMVFLIGMFSGPVIVSKSY